ncbi:hypothetical protein FRIGORI9N_100025 [Frigoribacterium sp. 9N]|nr:hypothetical protein FRIGORI9N_100025 [Frigoribacterium sp. 9N]
MPRTPLICWTRRLGRYSMSSGEMAHQLLGSPDQLDNALKSALTWDIGRRTSFKPMQFCGWKVRRTASI